MGDANHGPPDVPAEDLALLERLPPSRWNDNGVPTVQMFRDRQLASQVAGEVLADHLYPGGLRTSPLGPGWSSDIDAHVRRLPPREEMSGRGWVALDGLLRQVGVRTSGRWAVIEDGRVLSALDLEPIPPPDPLRNVLRRCERRDEVRLREVLEVRALMRQGHHPSVRDGALSVAADIEAALGGDQLERWRTGARPPIPAPLGRRSRLRRGLGRVRRRVTPRVVVAISGVDGAGKSTLVRQLRSDLDRAGVPNGHVWARPGNDLGWLDAVARLVKRLLGRSTAPSVGAAARGEGAELPSRRGFVGWMWSTLVTVSFLAHVWRQHVKTRGVVLYDRHLLDALATLDVVYGDVDLAFQRWLVRRGLPTADLAVHLDVPAEVSVRRKPDVTFGERAVRRQLEVYDRLVNARDDVVVLDATRSPSAIALCVFHRLVTT
ncbi:MAG: hypothetical protein KY469_20190 [Actinobacteria bacterium]|nr:hypothetical protein [Actinomycetota bacterium]